MWITYNAVCIIIHQGLENIETFSSRPRLFFKTKIKTKTFMSRPRPRPFFMSSRHLETKTKVSILHLQYSDSQTCTGMSWAGPFLPSKLPLLVWRYGCPSNIWCLKLTRVHIPNGIMISSATFTEITVITDRQTNGQSICSNRPHLSAIA